MNGFLELVAVQLAVALGLGLLVGLQREWVEDKPLGLRSFALITLIGALLGLYVEASGYWIVAVGLLAVTVAIITHSLLLAREAAVEGMTTELSGIAMFLVGAMTTTGYLVEAVVLTGVVTLLLHWKLPLHTLTRRIEPEEFQAVARFVLVTLVVLPILPNQAFGPYEVLNPFQIWLMVVLIVGLNLAGYFALQFFGGRGGALLGGVLGGLISSTATTVSFSARSREDRNLVPLAAVVILIASGFVYARILIETAAVAPALLGHLVLPVLSFSVLFAAVILAFLFRFEDGEGEAVSHGNPAQLSTALVFGAVYSVVIFISAAVYERFGATMLYPVAVLSGLTDVDAITLSTAQLFREGRLVAETAWRVIFVASLANLVFKGGVVALLGGPALRRRVLPAITGLTLAGVRSS
ncbi:MAG: MgtC/SapB family protein [Pseudomonadota bacterium]